MPAPLIRRSNLLVPVRDIQAVQSASRSNTDAITLDLEDGIPEAHRPAARRMLGEAVTAAGRGGAEVFVRVNPDFIAEELELAFSPALTGIVLPQVEDAEQVLAAERLLSELEKSRGIARSALQIIVLLESARAVWRVGDILRSSQRISQAGLDESDLAASMGIFTNADCDALEYARGRLAVEAVAVGVQPILLTRGMPERVINNEAVVPLAAHARSLGFRGLICPHPSWVEPVNAAMSPTAEQVAYYTEVRRVFAEAVAAGTAAAPLGKRMIDVPVDEWAAVVLETAAACARKDAEKKAATTRVRD